MNELIELCVLIVVLILLIIIFIILVKIGNKQHKELMENREKLEVAMKEQERLKKAHEEYIRFYEKK